MSESVCISLLLIHARAGRLDALKECLSELPAPETGCLAFEAGPSPHNKGLWQVRARWHSLEAMERYWEALPASTWIELVNRSVATHMAFHVFEGSHEQESFVWGQPQVTNIGHQGVEYCR
jgi:quinol monooxygenase YgiN